MHSCPKCDNGSVPAPSLLADRAAVVAYLRACAEVVALDAPLVAQNIESAAEAIGRGAEAVRASIIFDPRAADLRELAELCNAHATEQYRFDLNRPLRLYSETPYYWLLEGVGPTGGTLRHQWVQGRSHGRDDLRADLDRCHGIEATNDAETALDRLRAVERKRAAARKESP